MLILWLCYSEVCVISFLNSGRRELFLLTIILPSVGETLIIGVFSLWQCLCQWKKYVCSSLCQWCLTQFHCHAMLWHSVYIITWLILNRLHVSLYFWPYIDLKCAGLWIISEAEFTERFNWESGTPHTVISSHGCSSIQEPAKIQQVRWWTYNLRCTWILINNFKFHSVLDLSFVSSRNITSARSVPD